ncbi:MAG: hypothetical protein ACJ8FO_02465 [Sphingomicrobium sp.]
MSRVEAAAAMDRLPWLSDEPRAEPAKARRGNIVLWIGGLVAAVVGAGFWIGANSADEVQPPAAPRGQPTTIVPLPKARPIAPEVRLPAQPQLRPAPVPEVRTVAAPQVHIAAPPAPRKPVREQVAPAAPTEKAVPEAPRATTPPPAAPPVIAAPKPKLVVPRPWNPRIIEGAAGRVVQVGAFGSIRQAKQGWWFMVRTYPAMSRLPAVVRVSSNSRGRVFYRFQVGTTSQAHSEILCQRMARIGLSCAVVGLPWKVKVER